MKENVDENKTRPRTKEELRKAAIKLMEEKHKDMEFIETHMR